MYTCGAEEETNACQEILLYSREMANVCIQVVTSLYKNYVYIFKLVDNFLSVKDSISFWLESTSVLKWIR